MRIIKQTNFFFILFTFLAFASACQSTDIPQAGTGENGPTGDHQQIIQNNATFFEINEIGLGENGYISLTNFTDTKAGLSGLYLCQGSNCFALPDVVVDPGATVRISVGSGSGLENVVATNADIGELIPSDGEIALLSSNNHSNPEDMAVYFQWGSDPHKLTKTALKAGLWVEGGYGPTSDAATRLFKVKESGLWLFEE